MIVVSVAVAAVIFLLVTHIGVLVIERMYPPPGRMIDVRNARLHVVELVPPVASSAPPIVMIHGASANLEALGELGRTLAKTRRVILIVPVTAGARGSIWRIRRRRCRPR